MKLIITQPEIEAIVRAHVENTVQLREGADMKIDFTATRSEDGITATIDIPYLGVAGIPEIAAAADAKPAAAAPAPAKTAAKPRAVAKTQAASLLGAGSAGPATEAAANPEPVKDDTTAAADAVAETVAAGDGAETAADADAAPFEAGEAAAEPAAEEAAPAAAPATTRGPSLFGN